MNKTDLAVGCHLSSSNGFAAMGRQALAIGATTFQFFTRNPRGTQAKPMDAADAEALNAILREHAFAPVIAHAPYTLNPCSADPHLRALATEIIADDLNRLAHIPTAMYNLHPGSHGGQGPEAGTAQTAAALDAASRDTATVILLETMAGKGRETGGTFRELGMILEKAACSDRLGVCLDTCHVWDGGYDIVDRLDTVLAEFDREIGLEKLKAVHCNDSLNACGAKKDRHAKIGEGAIGIEGMRRIITHPVLRHLPFCLETPNDIAGYAKEIQLLRKLYETG